MYKTIIRPVVMCGSEARCLTANDEKNFAYLGKEVAGPICGLEEKNK